MALKMEWLQQLKLHSEWTVGLMQEKPFCMVHLQETQWVAIVIHELLHADCYILLILFECYIVINVIDICYMEFVSLHACL